MELIKLTKASDEDAFLLSSIAIKAKSHWDYPKEWIELWREDLTLSVDFINQNQTYVLKNLGNVLGFCVIIDNTSYFEIEHCWVLPEHIGKGYGKRILDETLAKQEFKDKKFRVLSDPNAIGFYQKFGFETIKQIPGKPEGRFLPLMEMVNEA